ncbi:MAG: hypothetical protein KBE91_07720 [Bacteroidia bacterium]|nr:hypothetical protein [Bacteroidia bacterium]MBP9689482.1 hypothetical protein [Bacteroidia bacterium]
MKRIFTLIIVALLPTLFAFKQASNFPTITCTNLKDKQVILPTDVANKRTVIALMLSTKADKQMQKWSQPLYNSLMADGMGGMMSGNMYNANLCFVGAVKGLAKLALPEIIKKAKTEVDKKYHGTFMYTDTDLKELMSQLNITDKTVPHFIVIEKTGAIIYQTSGEYSKEKLDDITGALLN